MKALKPKIGLSDLRVGRNICLNLIFGPRLQRRPKVGPKGAPPFSGVCGIIHDRTDPRFPTLAMVAGKITSANAAVILEVIRNKTKRDCEAFLSRISMAVRHEVWSRDEGRCTWTEVDGTRCHERMMLELDHSQTLDGYGAGVDCTGSTI